MNDSGGSGASDDRGGESEDDSDGKNELEDEFANRGDGGGSEGGGRFRSSGKPSVGRAVLGERNQGLGLRLRREVGDPGDRDRDASVRLCRRWLGSAWRYWDCSSPSTYSSFPLAALVGELVTMRFGRCGDRGRCSRPRLPKPPLGPAPGLVGRTSKVEDFVGGRVRRCSFGGCLCV